MAVYQPPIPIQPYGQPPYGQPQPPQYNHMYAQPQPPPAPAPAAAPANVEVLASETRQQNTEVRLSLSKVSDKVDRMYEKVGVLVHLFRISGMHDLWMKAGE